MPIPIRLFFDYVDPLSRSAESLAGTLESRGLTVERTPLELRAPPQPMLDPRDPALLSRYEVAARLGPPGLGPPPERIPWTRKAHELGMHARERGVFPRVHSALLSAHLCRALDIGRVDVLVELAVALGLDRTETKAVLDVDRHTEAIVRIRDHAFASGIRTVPCFAVGATHFQGFPDADELERAARDE